MKTEQGAGEIRETEKGENVKMDRKKGRGVEEDGGEEEKRGGGGGGSREHRD